MADKMADRKAFSAGTGLMALMALMASTGCDSGGRIQEPAASKARIGTVDFTGSSEFDRELIAAKAGLTDLSQREEAMAAVLDKYGIAHPPVPAFSWTSEGTPAAAKGNAASFYPVRRDFTAGNDIHTYRSSVSVANGQWVRIAALGNTDNVDPYLVAYYTDDVAASSSAYKVKVIGYNDDVASDNRNSVVTWTNNTGSAKNIQFVAFSFAASTRGKGLISTTVGATSVNLPDREIGGMHLYGATPIVNEPGNCVPSYTRVKETPVSGGGYRAAALVIDTQAMRGGYIQDTPALGTQTLNFSWIFHNPYPSFALLFEPYTNVLPSNWSETPSQYRLTQIDVYSCVN